MKRERKNHIQCIVHSKLDFSGRGHFKRENNLIHQVLSSFDFAIYLSDIYALHAFYRDVSHDGKCIRFKKNFTNDGKNFPGLSKFDLSR